MKKILQKILYVLAKAVLLRYRPQVIGITGSVGKTSTKEAVYAVLKNNFKVRKNISNYNNEIGLPLTILGCQTQGKNILGWIFIIVKTLLMLVYWNYPKILVLEMGADRPGDISYLTKLAPCYIGVITAIGEHPSHLENFKNVEQVVKEKSKIINHINEKNFAVINTDDIQLKDLTEKTKAKLMTIGSGEKAKIKVSDIHYSTDLEEDIKNNKAGINFKVNYEGNSIPFNILNVLGTPQVYAALNAIAVGLIYGMNLVDIAAALKGYESPKGRMKILPGIKETILIDDTYNSSPLACKRALEVIKNITVTGRKIVCLGSMEELGEESRRAHRYVGRLVREAQPDILFTIGEKAKDIAQSAKEKGLSSHRIFTFSSTDDARKTIQNEIHRGDVVLIKGSQSVRMEAITKEIMAEPLMAKQLLIRQDKSWQK